MKICKLFFLTLYVLLILFCFYNSLQNANLSSQMSGGLTNYIVMLIEKVFPNLNLEHDLLHSLVRKIIGHYLYHVIVGIVGIIVYILFVNNNKKALIISLVVSFILATIDELLQLFAEGRSCSVKDVAINYCGFLTGIMIFEIIYKIKKTKKVN